MNMGCIVKAELGRSSSLYHLTSESAALRDLEDIWRQANQYDLNLMRAVHDRCLHNNGFKHLLYGY